LSVSAPEGKALYNNLIFFLFQYRRIVDDTNDDCFRPDIDGFKPFFDNLEFYSVEESKDTFVFRDGPLIAPFSGSLVERWTMGPLQLPFQPRVPTTYQSIVNTGQAGKTADDTKINFHFFFLGKPAEPFFRIPLGC